MKGVITAPESIFFRKNYDLRSKFYENPSLSYYQTNNR